MHAQNAVSGGPDTVGNVVLILRVMPESPDVDLDDLKARLRAEVKGLQDIQEEPIGFGLKALKIAVVVSDAAGESDATEGQIMALDGVERAEIVELTLT
jgi:elongation factor 1-beta